MTQEGSNLTIDSSVSFLSVDDERGEDARVGEGRDGVRFRNAETYQGRARPATAADKSRLRGMRARDAGLSQTVKSFPFAPPRIITRLETEALLKRSHGKRVKQRMINLSLDEIDRMLMVFESSMSGSRLDPRERMRTVEDVKKRVESIFQEATTGVMQEFHEKWRNRHLQPLVDEARLACEPETDDATTEEPPEEEPYYPDDLTYRRLLLLKKTLAVEDKDATAQAQRMEMGELDEELTDAMRDMEQTGVLVGLQHVSQKASARKLITGPGAAKDAAWLNSKLGMGPEAAKKILKERAEKLVTRLGNTQGQVLAGSYAAMQPHRSLPAHEQHLARPDGLSCRIASPNMPLYHDMMKYRAPTMQELYKIGGAPAL